MPLSMSSDTPISLLQFSPIYQERVWGGRNLSTLYGRTLPKDDAPYGESWEICDREDAQSMVLEGPYQGKTLHELWINHRVEIFGEKAQSHPAQRFPLLIKILDAAEDLSIQVHPDDESAIPLQAEGKSEVWYIAKAAQGSKVYAGLKANVSSETLAQAIDQGTVIEQMHVLSAEADRTLAIPGGTVHAIGAGLVIFEIQQNSDTTYRVFDWNRLGLDGNPRELHREAALQVTNYHIGPVNWLPESTGSLLDWPYFKLKKQKLVAGATVTASPEGEFAMGAIISGQAQGTGGESLVSGDFFLLPACLPKEKRAFLPTQDTEILWITL